MTHSNALDIDLSLRIAPSSISSGCGRRYERVFEIARNFRNEVWTPGTVRVHRTGGLPAFGDVNDGMDLTERLVAGRPKRPPVACGSRSVDATST